jgi:hypothetical protein
VGVPAKTPHEIFGSSESPLGREAQRALEMFGTLGERLNESLTSADGLPSPEWEKLAATYSKVVTALLKEARSYHTLRLDEERMGHRTLSPDEESRALVDAAVTLMSEDEFHEVVRRRGKR